MVSLMAPLRVVTVWDRLLVPAFVYFFGKLYPFRWVNDPRKSTAAAAGGCVLLRRDALDRIDGPESIAGALIDDCALADRVKSGSTPASGGIWLGLSHAVVSVRAYETLRPMWDTVVRTAYAQLDFSAIRLTGTVIVMLALYLAPPLASAVGLAALALSLGPEVLGTWLAVTGLAGWALMSASYLPMLGWYRTSPVFAPLLPVTAFLYTLMTVDSALRWCRGGGGGWKGRTYSPR
jgi:hopene-associated glycosyltransferase HpnB